MGAIFLFEVDFMAELLLQIKENALFFGTSIGIMLVIFALAKLAERFWLHCRQVSSARRISIVGMCGAIAMVLYILDFSIPFLAPPFYKLDFSEVPVLLCGFFLGPSAGVACMAIKILLKLLLKGTTTAFVGDLANFVVGCSLVLPATIVYHLHKTRSGAIAGLITGTLVMTVFGSLFNGIYLLPKFAQLYGMPLDSIVAMGSAIHSSIHSVSSLVVLCVAPLNLLKGTCVSVLTLLLYKHVARPLFREA